MMKQKRFSLDCLRLTNTPLCDILDFVTNPSIGDCGVGHFLALMAKPPFKYFPTGCPFPVGFVRMVKWLNTVVCKTTIRGFKSHYALLVDRYHSCEY